MSILTFSKMQALGNDFVLINALSKPCTLTSAEIMHLGDRHRGIGFDQLLILSAGKRGDFFCQIFNADGSEAWQCGNGLRALARYIADNDLCHAKQFSLETKAGVFPVEIIDNDLITLSMGIPRITERLLHLAIAANPLALSIIDMGNPHAILRVESIKDIAAQELAAQIAADKHFPQGVNVGFMQVLTPSHILLRTIERGAGETHACGSNACAAAVAAIINGYCSSPLKVEFRYGFLTIHWAGEGQPLKMQGPAELVFVGEFL